MNLIRALVQKFRASSLVRVLGCLVLAVYLWQTYAFTRHITLHFGEKVFSSHQAEASVTGQDCLICDAAQIVPQAGKMVTTLKIAPLVETAPRLPPIFKSDNAILLPFGARAPPFSPA